MVLKRSSVLLTAALVILGCSACDRAAKHAAESLRGMHPREYAWGTVVLLYAENRGAMLSLGAGLPEHTRFIVFTAGVGVILAGLAAVLVFASGLTRMRVVGLSLIIAGGGGNLLDRLSNDGRVVDFVMLSAGGLRTGIFNVADVAILLGASFFLMTMNRDTRPARP